MKKTALCSFLVLLLVTWFPQSTFAQAPGGICGFYKTWMSFHGGLVFIGGEWMKLGYYGLDFSFYCAEGVVFLIDLGITNFELDFDDERLDDKWRWLTINPAMRYYFGQKSLMPFLTIGPGLYIPKKGNLRVGGKLGLGIAYRIKKGFILELGADYHHVFLKNNDLYGEQTSDFFVTHIGFILQL